MEVKIGVQHAQRELVVDTDSTPEDVETRLTEALAGNGVLRLSDVKGRTVIVPADKIAYLELGSRHLERRRLPLTHPSGRGALFLRDRVPAS